MRALRKGWRRLVARTRSERGQSMTEYMLLISVLVIGVIAATYDPMHKAYKDGSDQWKSKVTSASSKGGFGVQNKR